MSQELLASIEALKTPFDDDMAKGASDLCCRHLYMLAKLGTLIFGQMPIVIQTSVGSGGLEWNIPKTTFAYSTLYVSQDGNTIFFYNDDDGELHTSYVEALEILIRGTQMTYPRYWIESSPGQFQLMPPKE